MEFLNKEKSLSTILKFKNNKIKNNMFNNNFLIKLSLYVNILYKKYNNYEGIVDNRGAIKKSLQHAAYYIYIFRIAYYIFSLYYICKKKTKPINDCRFDTYGNNDVAIERPSPEFPYYITAILSAYSIPELQDTQITISGCMLA